jgi:hypothetical protein
MARYHDSSNVVCTQASQAGLLSQARRLQAIGFLTCRFASSNHTHRYLFFFFARKVETRRKEKRRFLPCLQTRFSAPRSDKARPGNLIYTPPSNFCSYFNCISSFWEPDDPGDGYVVQCADGSFSQSGGERGACSYHVGVSRPLYSH